MRGARFVIWAVAIFLTLMVGGLIWLALRSASDDGAAKAPDRAIYRDQLEEIGRDQARGVLAAEEAERARAEVARRLLAADARQARVTAGGPRWAALAAFALIGAGALALYAQVGAPGRPDMGLSDRVALAEELRAARPDQAAREAAMPDWTPPAGADTRYLDLVRQLRDAVAERPDDAQGLELLARHEAALGNLKAARAAQEQLVALRGEEATTEEWLTLAGLSIEAAGGFVTPEAEHALRQVLDRAPRNQPAQYYMGLMLIQTGRPDLAFRIWERLLREGPETAPWVRIIRGEIAGLAALAGVRYDPPAAARPAPALPGPDADAVAAAEDMTPEERQDMIRGMVEGLAERLASEGGGPEEWARLITALGILGETDRARAIYAEARQTFGAVPDALARVEAAAERAGIAE